MDESACKLNTFRNSLSAFEDEREGIRVLFRGGGDTVRVYWVVERLTGSMYNYVDFRRLRVVAMSHAHA